MDQKYHITQKFFREDLVLNEDEKNSQFLGYVVLDIATSHKDRGRDVLTKRFLQKTVEDLKSNDSFFA